MFITLELKTMSANFKISPLYLLRSTLNFPRPVLFRACQTYFKTLQQKFCCCFCCVLLISLCKHQTDYLGKINSTNVRMRATRFTLKATAVVFHRGLKTRHAIQIRNQLKQIKVIFQFTHAKSYFLVMKLSLIHI